MSALDLTLVKAAHESQRREQLTGSEVHLERRLARMILGLLAVRVTEAEANYYRQLASQPAAEAA